MTSPDALIDGFSARPWPEKWVAAEHLDIDAVIDQFGGNSAIRAQFDALVTATTTASLALFLEHLPNELPRWVSDPIGRAAMVERQLIEVVAFLRHREILHLDGHFANIRADDDRLYLADFGLATSPRFDFSDAERDFARSNADHDADYTSMRLVNWLVASVCGVPVLTKGDSVARNLFVQGARPVTSHRTCRRTLRRSSPGTPPPPPGRTNFDAACSMATCTPHTLASHALAR